MADNPKKELTVKQHKVLLGLLNCAGITEAAQWAKVGESTVYRFLRDPVFRGHYCQMRREQVQQSITRLQQAAGGAVTTLVTITTDPTALASTRVSAARTILEMTFKATEMESLEERLSQLEKEFVRLCEEREPFSQHE